MKHQAWAHASSLRRFQALLKTYDLLAELILCTIRVDVRCRAFFHLELAAKEAGTLLYHTAHNLTMTFRATINPRGQLMNQTLISSISTETLAIVMRSSTPPCPLANEGALSIRACTHHNAYCLSSLALCSKACRNSQKVSSSRPHDIYPWPTSLVFVKYPGISPHYNRVSGCYPHKTRTSDSHEHSTTIRSSLYHRQ
jgi:hypothetical protein